MLERKRGHFFDLGSQPEMREEEVSAASPGPWQASREKASLQELGQETEEALAEPASPAEVQEVLDLVLATAPA